MPTKQELMDMMDNRLPGEALPLRNTAPVQPPAYPDLERVSYASQHHMEYQQQQQQPQIYTIRQPTTTINIQPPQFGTRSQLANCPMCSATQMTRCEYKSSMMTHIIATILGITTCCCCLPYCFDSCKSARHYCQNCGSYLGGHTK
ncbi:lipopolysaccharide-induced tumor necrosis factor-alpha factor homolog [Calliphora vicina]|uniref:lipopolysaccharide-induced tumor necrosis factor-alpha factor homolog n=1 Tax=Calliphora vicina TaxID=7373 RepID=UPI00325B97B7